MISMFKLLYGANPLEWAFGTIWRLTLWDSGLMMLFASIELVSFWPIPPTASRADIAKLQIPITQAEYNSPPGFILERWPPGPTLSYLLLWPVVAGLYHVIHDYIQKLSFVNKYKAKPPSRTTRAFRYLHGIFDLVAPVETRQNVVQAVQEGLNEEVQVQSGISTTDLLTFTAHFQYGFALGVFEIDLMLPAMAAIFGHLLGLVANGSPTFGKALGFGPSFSELGVLPGMKIEDEDYWVRFTEFAFESADPVW
jgi:hypothetical protein